MSIVALPDNALAQLDAALFGPVPELTKYTLYGGDVELFFDKENHEYIRFEGDDIVSIPGVTTVTHSLDKPALVPWAAKMTCTYLRDNFDLTRLYTAEEFEALLEAAKRNFQDYKEEAAETGKVAHDWLDRFIKSKIADDDEWRIGLAPEDPRAANGVDSALAWMDEHHVEWIASERKLYSRKYDYAGTLDGLAVVDGKLSIIDFKTSNYLYRLDHGLQTAAYEAAQEEEYGFDVEDRWVLRLNKEDATFQAMHLTHDAFEHDLTTFLSLLDTYRNIELHKILERIEKAEKKAEAKAEKEAAKLAEKIAKAAAKEQAKAEKAAAKEALKAAKAIAPAKRRRSKG